MTAYVLETENIVFSYLDGTRALDDLSLRIPSGKKIAVVGSNGAGKSTLFLHFNAINRNQQGRIKYQGQPLDYSTSMVKELRKNVGIVFQDPDMQLFSASVYQDASFGPLNLGWPEAKVRAKVEEALRQTGVWDIKDKPIHFLSFGQKKRVAMAGVLAMEPAVLILDEPTSGLDPLYCREILALLDDLNKAGATVIISSHNIDEVLAWADQVYVLQQGRLVAKGDPREVFSKAAVLAGASLTRPWVLEIYEQMLARGIIKAQAAVPRCREDILRLLEGNNYQPNSDRE